MNVYNFSKGQLIVMWLGGFFMTAMSISVEPFGGAMSSLAIIIDTAIVVYTIGWRNYKKSKDWEEWRKEEEYKMTHKNPFKEER